jgi:hypothetical protein
MGLPAPSKQHRPTLARARPSSQVAAVVTMAVGGAGPTGAASEGPPRLAAAAVKSWRRRLAPATEILGGSHPKEVSMAHAHKEAARRAVTTDPGSARPPELPRKQAAPPTTSAPERGRAARRGAWSPRTTLAYCWRSRTLLGLGAWLAVSPWVLGTTGDRHSTQSALLTGVLLMGTGVWALLTREPIWPQLGSLTLGIWLLAAPSLWYFQSRLASQTSLAVGLVVVALSIWLLWTGPRTRPPVDPAGGDAHRSGRDHAGPPHGRP